MRAIDADALSKKLLEELHNRSMQGFGKGLMIANSCVINAPTIEPERKKGTWLVHLYEFGKERYECDQCQERCDMGYRYCPNCGADMRQGEGV